MQKEATTDSPIHDLIRLRWSPRAFSDRMVEPAKLRSLLEAARWAPSSFNEQPWAFVVATRDSPAEHSRLLSILVPGNAAWARRAPVLILSITKLNFDANGAPNRHAMHDVGLATENLVTQATALGLSVHQMAGFDAQKAREEFSIPANWEPMTAIAIGYVGDPNSLEEPLRTRELAPRTRKPLEQYVFTGRWGQPATSLTRAREDDKTPVGETR